MKFVGGPSSNKQATNLYGYCEGNPIGKKDEWGAYACWWDEVHETITAHAYDAEIAALKADKKLVQNEDWLKSFKSGLKKGSYWQDLPEGLLKLNEVVDAVKDGKVTEKIRASETYKSHFGEKQYWHSMAPPGKTAEQIVELIIKDADFWYDEADKARKDNPELSGNYLGRVLHMVEDSFTTSHTERTATGEISGFQDYSAQDPDKHHIADVPKEGNPESWRNLVKSIPVNKKDPKGEQVPNLAGAERATAIAGRIIRAFLLSDKAGFGDIIKNNYKLAENAYPNPKSTKRTANEYAKVPPKHAPQDKPKDPPKQGPEEKK